MNNFEEFFREHKFTILFVLAGLILAVLFMTIGFWRTLLLAVILALGIFFGILMDRNGTDGVRGFFGRLFDRNNKK